MSFIETYGGNKETMAHSGLAAVNRARAAGLSDADIIRVGIEQGISWGTKAREALANSQQGMTNNEYEYQKAIDLANIQAATAAEAARIQSESAERIAGIQERSALGVANIDKQIKQMQLESAENLQKLSNSSKLTLANAATNQGILAGLVNAFNF